MMEKLKPVLAGKPSSYFVQFIPYAPKEVIDAQYVQVITITGSAASEGDLRSLIEKFKAMSGCTGASSGLTTEDVEGKGKLFVAVVGWESLDASKAAQTSVNLGSAGGAVESHHVNFRFPVKGFRGL